MSTGTLCPLVLLSVGYTPPPQSTGHTLSPQPFHKFNLPPPPQHHGL